MLKLKESAAVVVAAETKTAIDDIDQAYVSHLKMTAEAVDGLRNSGLALGQSQQLMMLLNEGQSDLIAMRRKTQKAISLLADIHQRSDQAEVALGCPDGWGFFSTAEKPDHAVATKIAASA